jgi:DNA-binding response OmpR family regulator
MSDTETAVHPKPLILLASGESEQLHDLQTALFSVGYRVVIARSERETLQRAREHHPDGVVLDGEIASPEHSLCATLTTSGDISPATPIILTRIGPLTRTDRLATLGEGAWELQSELDMEELLVRLGVYLRAKLEVDRIARFCLVDEGTGLYNSQGFAQRTEELGALTTRQGRRRLRGLPSRQSAARPHHRGSRRPSVQSGRSHVRCPRSHR